MNGIHPEVREYIDSFEGEVKRRLLLIRDIVPEHAPEAITA